MTYQAKQDASPDSYLGDVLFGTHHRCATPGCGNPVACPKGSAGHRYSRYLFAHTPIMCQRCESTT